RQGLPHARVALRTVRAEHRGARRLHRSGRHQLRQRPARCPALPQVMRAAAAVELNHVRDDAAGCRNCELWKGATQTVFGEGRVSARLMLVGEQPGDREDIEGKPFVGPDGRLLDRALDEAAIARADVYITNAV